MYPSLCVYQCVKVFNSYCIVFSHHMLVEDIGMPASGNIGIDSYVQDLKYTLC